MTKLDKELSERKRIPSLTNPNMTITYGKYNLTNLIENMIILDLTRMIGYNEDTQSNKKEEIKCQEHVRMR